MSKAGKKDPSGSRGLFIVGAIAVVATGALIAFGVMSQNKAEAPAPMAPIAAKSDAELKANRNQEGNPQAKVQIVEWGDYL